MRIRTIITLVVAASVLAACASTGSGDGGSSEVQVATTQGATESTSVEEPPPPTARDDASSSAETPETTIAHAGTDTTEASGEGSDAESADSREDVRDNTDVSPGETVPTTVPSPTVTGEVPQAYLDAVLADAAERTGVRPAAPEILRSESNGRMVRSAAPSPASSTRRP